VEGVDAGVVVSKQAKANADDVKRLALTNCCVWADNGTRASQSDGVDVSEYVRL
jgi:hypothetical protein